MVNAPTNQTIKSLKKLWRGLNLESGVLGHAKDKEMPLVGLEINKRCVLWVI